MRLGWIKIYLSNDLKFFFSFFLCYVTQHITFSRRIFMISIFNIIKKLLLMLGCIKFSGGSFTKDAFMKEWKINQICQCTTWMLPTKSNFSPFFSINILSVYVERISSISVIHFRYHKKLIKFCIRKKNELRKKEALKYCIL